MICQEQSQFSELHSVRKVFLPFGIFSFFGIFLQIWHISAYLLQLRKSVNKLTSHRQPNQAYLSRKTISVKIALRLFLSLIQIHPTLHSRCTVESGSIFSLARLIQEENFSNKYIKGGIHHAKTHQAKPFALRGARTTGTVSRFFLEKRLLAELFDPVRKYDLSWGSTVFNISVLVFPLPGKIVRAAARR